MSVEVNDDHEFTGKWRWPRSFREAVKQLIPADATTLNVCAGLSDIGDIRVDLKSIPELIAGLQADSTTDLAEARSHLSGVVDDSPDFDVIGALYGADDPTTASAATYADPGGDTLRANVLEQPLPVPDDSVDVSVCDPPWLAVEDDHRDHIFEQLCRVTRPGGRIVFNANWLPTGSYPVVLDDVIPRQDTEDSNGGYTPKVSWVGVYRVLESVDVARHLHRTLPKPDYEHIPSPDTAAEATRAERMFHLSRYVGVDLSAINEDAADPTDTERCCTECGCSHLEPLNVATTTPEFDDLYECRDCGFRLPESEL